MRIFDLFEAVPLSLYRPLHGQADPHLYDAIFDRFSAYQRGNDQRIYFPLKAPATPIDTDMDTAELVLDNINAFSRGGVHGFEYIFDVKFEPLFKEVTPIGAKTHPEIAANYLRGIVVLDGREIRIGKVLNRMEKRYREMAQMTATKPGRENIGPEMLADFLKVKRAYETDRARDLGGLSKGRYEVVISRHPYDMAGISTGRGWTSCVNLTDGRERKYVLSHIKNGSLVAYLIHTGDNDIKRPVSRTVIERFENENDFILMASNDVYGAGGESFKAMVNRWCKLINRGKDDGLYCNSDENQYTGTVTKSGHGLEWDHRRRGTR